MPRGNDAEDVKGNKIGISIHQGKALRYPCTQSSVFFLCKDKAPVGDIKPAERYSLKHAGPEKSMAARAHTHSLFYDRASQRLLFSTFCADNANAFMC